MPISHTDYVPIIKWRQGEYQALWRLTDATKDRTVPLIEITPPDFDFETWTPSKTIDEHLAPFATRLHKKWGARLALLDCGLLDPAATMHGGKHPMLYLCEQAFAQNAVIVPVVKLTSDGAYRAAVATAQAMMQTGVALRCSLEEGMDTATFDAGIGVLLHQLDVALEDCDIVLDLEAPTWEPQSVLVGIVSAALKGSSAMAGARSITVAGTSFPASMADVTGPLQFWPRREWSFYQAVLASLGENDRIPGFGDYAIAGHGFAQGDMRLLKPAATIRYTCDDGWIIAKGSNVRDNGFGQYRHCSGNVTSSPRYLGATYSPGSRYIDACRSGNASTGNLSTWRWVGSNHHITKVVNDLATLFGL
ncbi:MAG: beta family protein [Erythrobacter sp.]